jgi:hypothetical protein
LLLLLLLLLPPDQMKSMRGSVFWLAPEVLNGKGYGERWCLMLDAYGAKHVVQPTTWQLHLCRGYHRA